MLAAFPDPSGIRELLALTPHPPHDLTLTVAALIALPFCLCLWLAVQNTRLRGIRAKLKLVLDNMNEGIVVLDSDGCIVLVNTVGWRAMPVSSRKLSYNKVHRGFEAFSADGTLLPTSEWPSSRALRGDFVTDFVMLYRRKGSTQMGSRVLSTARAPEDGHIRGHVVITYRDGSDRRHTDEARTRLAAIVESSEDAIVSQDVHGVVTTWNRAAETIFGYTATEMIGKSIKRLLPPDRHAEEDDILARILRGENVDHFDTVCTTKDGRSIQVSLSLSPIKDITGRVIGASKIARDITATYNLQRQLQQAQKMEAIGQLTGGIAHDFNNLLGIVIASLDLLESAPSQDDTTRKRVHTAQKAALRGADLTRRLLTFASEQQLQPCPTSLRTAVRNTLEIASRALGPEIVISTCLDESLAPVSVDPAGLESSLLNLLLNARDAMPGGGELRITTGHVVLEENAIPIQIGLARPRRLRPRLHRRQRRRNVRGNPRTRVRAFFHH